MFGAPDHPRLGPDAKRRAGVGDHVCICGGYVGLIVDMRPGGLATVAKRSPSGAATVESDVLADTLTVLPRAPLCANEARDPAWRRGVLG